MTALQCLHSALKRTSDRLPLERSVEPASYIMQPIRTYPDGRVCAYSGPSINLQRRQSFRHDQNRFRPYTETGRTYRYVSDNSAMVADAYGYRRSLCYGNYHFQQGQHDEENTESVEYEVHLHEHYYHVHGHFSQFDNSIAPNYQYESSRIDICWYAENAQYQPFRDQNTVIQYNERRVAYYNEIHHIHPSVAYENSPDPSSLVPNILPGDHIFNLDPLSLGFNTLTGEHIFHPNQYSSGFNTLTGDHIFHPEASTSGFDTLTGDHIFHPDALTSGFDTLTGDHIFN